MTGHRYLSAKEKRLVLSQVTTIYTGIYCQ